MTSTIKVDNIQNQCGANIINESSNTITIGASGDTVSLASGASQTGFGRTGTVDWDTTKKTASFTATNGDGFFIDTSSSAITATLPASPSAGNIVAFSDYNGSFGTNFFTIGRNGSNINGEASNFVITKNNVSVQLIYVDATEGWRIVLTGSVKMEGLQETFICATGGTITTCGNDKIHTFTGPGTFTVNSLADTSANNRLSYLVIAGGGAGGDAGARGAGGGGAGGFRECKSPTTPYTASPLDGAGEINATEASFPITVGAGGAGRTTPNVGNNGSNSVFSTITSTGGGGGGGENPSSPITNGQPGGSGGGAGRGGASGSGGSGNTPPVSPAQGTGGGNSGGSSDASASGGGGGGALAGGGNGASSSAGDGGTGATTGISGSDVARAGGGGGASGSPTDSSCGSAGGGSGNPWPGSGCGGTGGNATANSGSGGGGASTNCGGGNGGSGVVIIRYKFQN